MYLINIGVAKTSHQWIETLVPHLTQFLKCKCFIWQCSISCI